ncbi:MAG: hypothetical protein AAF417_03665 [Pseudomonadota bacterium]
MKRPSLASRFNEHLWNYPRLHHYFHSALAKAYPPPYLVTNTEVLHGASEAVGCAKCAEGRVLGESGAAPQYMRPKPPELFPAKLGGSREGHPINKAAFRTALPHSRDALQILGVLRQEYMKRTGRTTSPLPYTDLFALCEIGMSFPAYFLRRTDNRIASGEVPPAIATVFKIVAGLRKLAGHMIAIGASESPPHTAEQLWQITENDGLLVSDFSEEVCPAADKLILKFIHVAITDEGQHVDLPEVVSDVPLDLDRLMEYTMSCVRMKLAFMISSNEIEKAFLAAWRKSESEQPPNFTAKEVLEQRIKVLSDALQRASGETFLAELAAADIDRELREMKTQTLDITSASNDKVLAALGQTRHVLRCAVNFSSQQQQLMNTQLGWPTNEEIAVSPIWDRIAAKANPTIAALEAEHFSQRGILSLIS